MSRVYIVQTPVLMTATCAVIINNLSAAAAERDDFVFIFTQYSF